MAVVGGSGEGGALAANARMYAPNADAAAAWRALFDWVSARSGVPLAVLDHAFPARLEDLWSRDDLGATFMCGWPFVRAGSRHRIVAAPVPAAARYGGRAEYRTDFVVRAESAIHRLEDSFGGRLAFTVDHSQSGYNAPRHHLLRFRTAERPNLYAATVGPCVTPKRVLDTVLDGSADVAPLDGYTLELMLRHDPELGKRIRIVASTDPVPMPPLVASPSVPDEAVEALRAAFLASGEAPALEAVRDALVLAGFAVTDPADYAVTERWAAEALAAGYPAPG
ncbi:PhnD/SsuA/transferrin family substrate-binding protein [Azospirillum sp. TSH64]|uniref:phosphate/phosphite/phosphonate ABC transporter substrate-binding protein n=1 Tax=Azospirillum sp. TSH64 TaxID=652740 RepID=UPI000D645647|nr:PhnD/SsuA/transferrin family substrate-binding protein [Azospirillum sp. TSH64]